MMEPMECNLLTSCQMTDFNYQAMEEELTCPVCLELYADPLMLPCSHSMCKKCLEVIVDCKASKCENFECPSCRAVLSLDREKMLLLPKNLALENIVVRFTEERSRSINQCRLSACCERDDDVKAASSSANNEVPAQHEVARRPVSMLSALETVTLSGTIDCGLCDASGPPCRAIWFCQQCKVSYCSGCLKKFHPQRGALAKHHLQPAALCEPPNRETAETAFCTDHVTEQASMFCDRCKLYVCHLCVCDGEGRHAGHKMLSPDAACAMIKNLANKTKEQSDSLLATLLDEQTKLDAHSTEMKALCVVSCAHVEQQYQRFIDDLTTALIAEKQLILNSLDEARQRICRQTDSHNRDNERCSRLLSELSSACQRVGEESTAVGILSHAAELQPLVIHMKRHRREVGLLRKRCESILKDKSSKLQLLSGTEQFRKRIVKLLSWFVDDGISGSDSIIPHIITSSSAVGKSELVPRVPNKYLTTWGFSSTTFTGESVSRPCSWTVTVERNTGHWGGPLATAGYLFGIGVSSVALGSKDVVGMTSTSHALVCVGGGALCFAHDGHQDVVAPPLDGLPVTVTIAIRQEAPDVTVFTYKLASVAEGRRISLVGRKILHDAAIYANAFPVFTVSQRVKILFPTYV